jgi:three-Cys-motif partner protein
MSLEQLKLFQIPEAPQFDMPLRRLKRPVWTENKAKLIERYLYFFVLVTKHGTYIDGFSGPQESEQTDMWSAKLVLESEPRWLKHFFLFEKEPTQVERIRQLAASQPPRGSKDNKRDINVIPGDFNENVHNLLHKGAFSKKEAAFCLLDQRTFECHWSTVKALAGYKTERYKIEQFYFLSNGWLDRALAAQKDLSVLDVWWGQSDWSKLRGMPHLDRAKWLCNRFRDELGYTFVTPWPIFERKGSSRVMYYMIHATDHPEAPKLMNRAYYRAVEPKESAEQFLLDLERSRTSQSEPTS